MHALSYSLLFLVSVYDSHGLTALQGHESYGDLSDLYEKYETLSDMKGKNVHPPNSFNTNPLSFDYRVNLNGFFDYIIKIIKFVIHESGDFIIPLPDVTKPFSTGVIHGKLTGTNGFFRDIASLERTADAEMKFNGSKLYLSSSFGLKEFAAGFRNYTLELGNIRQTGEMHFSAAKNSLSLILTYDVFHFCSLKVGTIEFKELDGMKVSVDGLGDFQGLVNVVTDWLMLSFRRTFRNAVNAAMEKNINAAIAQYMQPFCVTNYRNI